MSDLTDIRTPALVLDTGRLQRNLTRMQSRARELKVDLRPHMKTGKSVDVARAATAGQAGGVTVSTLAEAAYFAEAGFTDITYGVGITADKFAEVAEIAGKTGAKVNVVLDSLAAARALADWDGPAGAPIPALIEIDSGQHRAGIAADDAGLLDIARCLHDASGAELAGVMTHAGHSYNCGSVEDIVAVAEAERAAVVSAAERLRAAGLPCPVVSVGSTPTALHAKHLDGVTEMRPGVYMFGDRFQAALGSCDTTDLALSVLATVVGVYPARGLALINAGGLALSQDRSMDAVVGEPSYGAVYDLPGQQALDGLRLGNVNQEHGFLFGDVTDLAVGQRLRVFPNHACMTAAMYDHYHLVDDATAITGTWGRNNGW